MNRFIEGLISTGHRPRIPIGQPEEEIDEEDVIESTPAVNRSQMLRQSHVQSLHHRSSSRTATEDDVRKEIMAHAIVQGLKGLNEPKSTLGTQDVLQPFVSSIDDVPLSVPAAPPPDETSTVLNKKISAAKAIQQWRAPADSFGSKTTSRAPVARLISAPLQTKSASFWRTVGREEDPVIDEIEDFDEPVFRPMPIAFPTSSSKKRKMPSVMPMPMIPISTPSKGLKSVFPSSLDDVLNVTINRQTARLSAPTPWETDTPRPEHEDRQSIPTDEIEEITDERTYQSQPTPNTQMSWRRYNNNVPTVSSNKRFRSAATVIPMKPIDEISQPSTNQPSFKALLESAMFVENIDDADDDEILPAAQSPQQHSEVAAEGGVSAGSTSWLQRLDCKNIKFTEPTPQRSGRRANARGLVGQLHRALDRQKFVAARHESPSKFAALSKEPLGAPLVVTIVEEGDLTMPVLLCMCRVFSSDQQVAGELIDVLFPIDLISTINLIPGTILMMSPPWMQMQIPSSARAVVFCPKNVKVLDELKSCPIEHTQSIPRNKIVSRMTQLHQIPVHTLTASGSQDALVQSPAPTISPIRRISPYSGRVHVAARYLGPHSQTGDSTLILIADEFGSVARLEVSDHLLSGWAVFFDDTQQLFSLMNLNVKYCRHLCHKSRTVSTSCCADCAIVLSTSSGSYLEGRGEDSVMAMDPHSVAATFRNLTVTIEMVKGMVETPHRISIEDVTVDYVFHSIRTNDSCLVLSSISDSRRSTVSLWACGSQFEAISTGMRISVSNVNISTCQHGAFLALDVYSSITPAAKLDTQTPPAGVVLPRVSPLERVLTDGFLSVRGVVTEALLSLSLSGRGCFDVVIDNGVFLTNIIIPLNLISVEDADQMIGREYRVVAIPLFPTFKIFEAVSVESVSPEASRDEVSHWLEILSL